MRGVLALFRLAKTSQMRAQTKWGEGRGSPLLVNGCCGMPPPT